ncbi:actin-binding protein WASF3 [Leptidea sinapis]|uniref:actin-binding protein WASF3 n=1 Tax=Leptidea sinapis TaxID=189913 RepID=UPI00213FA36F|nr:actin-binding protein WASF3 [Leptidea sinapis]XP_050665770.1 actin-binding protein WASF3 [Leptidea sinapis]XP_050665771.1 actin-binding protein WASF3 [Leptidea sinapis]
MPLPKRCVEPVHVSRGTVPERLAVPSELEAVTNGTLANTVRQLSSLSKHAEDMFGELTREASGLAERTNVLQARIDRLAIKVTQLDSGVEEVSLQDIQMRKAFRSSRTFQQQLFSRTSMPSAMLATYARCDRPPPLEKLNEFRDDGRDARKFYTDPDYFFELWRREMLQDTERIQHDRGKKVRQPRSGGAEGRGARRVRVPHSTRDRQKAEAVNRGEHIMAPTQLRRYNVEPRPDAVYRSSGLQAATTVPDGAVPANNTGGFRTALTRAPSQPTRPSSIEIDNQHRQPRLTGNGHLVNDESPYGAVEPIYGGSLAGTPRRARPSVPPPAPPAPVSPHHTPPRSSLPPPPPPPDSSSPPPMNGVSPPHHRTALDAHLDHMHAVIGMMSSEEGGRAPSPPPAPPAPPPPEEQRPRPPSPATLLRGASALKPAAVDRQPPPDPRSDLLKAIREGIKLRKVEKRCEDNVGKYDTLRGAPALHDVASILARRVAVEQSDTDSEDESDSDNWDQWTTDSRA